MKLSFWKRKGSMGAAAQRTAGKGDEREKRRRIPLQVYLVYLVVATFLVTGVTVSRYVAKGSGADSARVAKPSVLTLAETVDDTQVASDEGGVKTFMVTPGVNIKKDVKVKYTKSEMASYIFLEVDVTGWTRVDSGQGKDNLNFGAVPFTDQNGATDYKVKWAIDGGWKFLQTDDAVPGGTKKNVYYKTVNAGDAAGEINVIASKLSDGTKYAGVIVSPLLKNSELRDLNVFPATGMNIGFRAIAVQLDGFEKNNSNITSSEEHAEAAWASAKKNLDN